ncbi:conjugal transfer protein TrbI, partial [Serratia ureilytica]|nr:conjugal transfer protein TrbI [Serratia ureilytica]MDN2473859.1 conjugal transfer protein TrbI [Serratia ureilytica]
MANINVLVKRKQYLWLGAVALAVAAAIGGGYYFSQDAELETQHPAEPAPDLTGVVDNTFDDRVQQHAITQTQAAQAEINKQFTALRQEIDLLNKSRLEDQKRMQVLED